MEVFKFGGASVKDANAIKNLSQIIKKNSETPLLVVVSAMGKITNKLEDLTKAYLKNEPTEPIFEEIKDYHFQIINELFTDKNHQIFNEIANTFVEIDWILEESPIDNPNYIYDQIVSMGEIISTKIISAFLQYENMNAVWVDARNYIQTDNNYQEGNVNWEKTAQEIMKNLPQLIAKKIVITQGFIGNTSENFTTTLGREGSDYSAAIFASCLNANALTIWKDVPGVLNADPKWFDETEKIDYLSYYDAIELAYYGATVIHPKTIKPLQNKNIPLYVRSFINPTEKGTKIGNIKNETPTPCFIFKVNQTLISILPKDFSFIIEENLSTIFNVFHQHKVKINTMLNSALSFSVSVDGENDVKIQKLIDALSKSYIVKYNQNLELVTIRYYNQQTINRVTENKTVLLEVKSRHTCQIVMKNKN
ncbi:MAG: aspartate kinase [Sphingobacteriaceae bacterium]|nr:aspartate kinase [Sphingobacteriaceae bacterium]